MASFESVWDAGLSIKYLDEWVDAVDMAAMWSVPDIREEWIRAGEQPGRKVLLSRNPDGHPTLTQSEMRAIVDIVTNRYFKGRLDPLMVCAIAEIESERQPFAYHYEPTLGEASLGLMQIVHSVAEWLERDLGYNAYNIEDSSLMLYRPFANVYFGAAFLYWLSTYAGKKRKEEFTVRAYSGGPKKASHKSTLQYWKDYQLIKMGLPVVSDIQSSSSNGAGTGGNGDQYTYWDDKVFPDDLAAMSNHPEVKNEWMKVQNEDKRVRFSQDSEKKPCLTMIELKAVAEIIVGRFFSSSRVRPAMLASLAEISSRRLLYGPDGQNGIMQVSFPTSNWLYRALNYESYDIASAEDLSNPFISMYFGAAYVFWLTTYEGSEQSEEFIIQAYMAGPERVNVQGTRHFWLDYLEVLPLYEPRKKNSHRSCTIL